MERTGSYGKDGHLWKRRAVMEKTGTYGKDGHLRKRRTLNGKDGQELLSIQLLSRLLLLL